MIEMFVQSQLCFRRILCGSEEKKQYVSLRYKDVLMHAICKDEAYFPRPCLYMQLDTTENQGGEDESGTDDPMEVRFVPESSEECMCFEVFEVCLVTCTSCVSVTLKLVAG